ncbi:RNA polymerase sigma factor [Sphingobacterium griseoflavum]|uniref:RNA polymerase sigma factor n=1 Tax=Sphingobacterium griseoflavum TaxID=1474952 RepID=UPI001673086A|nr:sigma-70 family RNA polymerase sigma factor [Sphingobacterium griseoflavum]
MEEIYIKKICEGNADAFKYIITTYKDMAFSIASSILKDQFSAEEVVQCAFIKAYKNIKTFKHNSKFSTWFYRIVVNEAFMYLKKKKKYINITYEELDTEVLDEDQFNAIKQEEQNLLIQEGLNRLNANESLALRLFYLDEQHIKEIVVITGWSESNVKTLLHRGRKNMLAILGHLMKTNF